MIDPNMTAMEYAIWLVEISQGEKDPEKQKWLGDAMNDLADTINHLNACWDAPYESD